MKYIRTEDGIYEVLHIWFDEDIDMNRYDTIEGVIDSIEIEKESNSIEELCDEFVNEKVILSKNDIKDILKYDKECLKTEIIYGAIWTDKGLIYVAKMNEKGELELI